ncbi:unnamed protein product [Gongylonema pulchrum]|uniref:Drf_FH3 domain-containing protein n=1 Tax=Gongylonema pulchrum TaxID=637853 RepID=A0A183DP73_9BILA|nr:unnamed protein product [Gongylonema pulchrum]
MFCTGRSPTGSCMVVYVLCYEILAGICLIPDGHPKVLRAITEARGILGERTRFQHLVDDIYRTYRNDRETERVRTAAMSLINALLSTGPAEVKVALFPIFFHSFQFLLFIAI